MDFFGFMELPDIPDLPKFGLPEEMSPAPFPFIPLPRGLITRGQGMIPWQAYIINEAGRLQQIGRVWGDDREEALEAAQNLVDVEEEKGNISNYRSVGVTRE